MNTETTNPAEQLNVIATRIAEITKPKVQHEAERLASVVNAGRTGLLITPAWYTFKPVPNHAYQVKEDGTIWIRDYELSNVIRDQVINSSMDIAVKKAQMEFLQKVEELDFFTKNPQLDDVDY